MQELSSAVQQWITMSTVVKIHAPAALTKYGCVNLNAEAPRVAWVGGRVARLEGSESDQRARVVGGTLASMHHAESPA